MATAQQIASAGVYVTDDIGVEVTDGSNVRAQLGVLSGGGFGLKIIGAGGTTTIIDGTLDVFKITATGTQSVSAPWSAPNSTNQSTSTTLTALGTLASTPGHLCYIGNGGAGQGGAQIFTGYVTALLYAAGSSGASPTGDFLALLSRFESSVSLNGSYQAVVEVSGNNDSHFSYTIVQRYYLLQEVSI